jgi:hypothetical protein
LRERLGKERVVFEVGKTYQIHTINPGAPDEGVTTHYNCVARDFQFPLLKVKNYVDVDWIINVSAATFAGANPQ